MFATVQHPSTAFNCSQKKTPQSLLTIGNLQAKIYETNNYLFANFCLPFFLAENINSCNTRILTCGHPCVSSHSLDGSGKPESVNKLSS